MNEYTLDTAKKLALECAVEKNENNKLIPADLWDDDVHGDGDFETVYSIISLYSDDENNDGTWTDKISNHLEGYFPTYF